MRITIRRALAASLRSVFHALYGLKALSVRMESYVRIRNNIFLVSFWKRATFHSACRPSRPGKNYGALWDALIFTLNWKPFYTLKGRIGLIQFVSPAATAAVRVVLKMFPDVLDVSVVLKHGAGLAVYAYV